MKVINPICVSLLALFFSISISCAATTELNRAVYEAVSWDNKKPTREDRSRLADAIEEYWVEFEKRVPRLSPKEREWVEEELKSQGDRLSRALSSIEYAIWSLNEHSGLCLSTIRSAKNSLQDEELRPTEMFYWLKMVNCYNGTSDLKYYLDRAGIDTNSDGSVSGIQIPISNLVQSTIVNKVAPMAMAETMGWTLNP